MSYKELSAMLDAAAMLGAKGNIGAAQILMLDVVLNLLERVYGPSPAPAPDVPQPSPQAESVCEICNGTRVHEGEKCYACGGLGYTMSPPAGGKCPKCGEPMEPLKSGGKPVCPQCLTKAIMSDDEMIKGENDPPIAGRGGGTIHRCCTNAQFRGIAAYRMDVQPRAVEHAADSLADSQELGVGLRSPAVRGVQAPSLRRDEWWRGIDLCDGKRLASRATPERSVNCLP